VNRLSLPYAALQRSWMLNARALGQSARMYKKLGLPGVVVFLDQLGDGVAAEAAAGLALDRERRHAEVREGVGVVFQWSPWLASERLLHEVAGTRLAPNCIPATPIELSWGEVCPQRWPIRKSQDARRTDNRGVARRVPASNFAPLGARLSHQAAWPRWTGAAALGDISGGVQNCR
jgi:hypothetical protein